jgi:hypothetical protein
MIAKREMEDAEAKRFIELQKHQRKEAELEKRRMLEQLARDKEERFGKKYDPHTQQSKKEYTPLENVEHYCKAINTLYPKFRGEEAANCFNTLKIVLNNIIKNPTEEKYRKVKQTNPNFQERVGKISIAMKIFAELGFVEEGDFLVAKNPDMDLYKNVVTLLDNLLA